MPIIEAHQAETILWDAVIIGTGMGGGTFGLSLARQGYRVLFCEKGPHHALSKKERTATAGPMSAGRYRERLLTKVGLFNRLSEFLPLIGEGVGGSSAIYGKALLRFGRDDMPADLWPITVDELAPYYEEAERLYSVRSSVDASVPLTPPNDEIARRLRAEGCHVGYLGLAGGASRGCQTCQTVLCQKNCKRHAGNACVEVAVRDYGADILTECAVEQLVVDGGRISHLMANVDGKVWTIKSKVVILAAGALNSPALLLASANEQWPDGLANKSGMVGRNLMRHYTDVYAVRTSMLPRPDDMPKQLGISDLYQDGGANVASLQSFGRLFSADDALWSFREAARASAGWLGVSAIWCMQPFIRLFLSWISRNFTILATIVRDAPHYNNRVTVVSDGDRKKLRVDYEIGQDDRRLIQAVRKQVKTLLSHVATLRPSLFPKLVVFAAAEDNRMLAHVCGTCRMGRRAEDSVVDRWNKAHDLENLYIVDASFFPTSGSTNPALTIAANALRVAQRVGDRLQVDREAAKKSSFVDFP